MLFTTPTQVPVSPVISIIRPAEQPKAPETVLYTIKESDSLEKIASETHTTVQKLFNKNTSIQDPNIIETGQTLVIPADSEVLAERAMISAPVDTGRPASIGGFSLPSGNTAGNTYFAGQCVWYIKNIVPWVQNGWGNASDWKYTSGHRVSPVPAAGTVAWAKNYGHVALVTGVGNGTITITEMNYNGVGVIDSRSAPTSEFEYIYP